MKKNIACFLLCLAMILTIIPIAIAPATATAPTGTVTDWDAAEILLQNATDVHDFSVKRVEEDKTFENQTIKLTNDIDMKDYSETENWKAFVNGSYNGPSGFAGTFDGQGHTISNIDCKQTKAGRGLFGSVAKEKSATIRDLSIVDSKINGGTLSQIGGIFGFVTGNVTIENVYLDIDVYGNDTCAGFIAYVSYDASAPRIITIRNSVFAGSVTATTKAVGFVGYATSNSKATDELTIENCAMYGSLTTANSNDTMAGFVLNGRYNKLKINHCISAGTFTSASFSDPLKPNYPYILFEQSNTSYEAIDNIFIKSGGVGCKGHAGYAYRDGKNIDGFNAMSILDEYNYTTENENGYWIVSMKGYPLPLSIKKMITSESFYESPAEIRENTPTDIKGYQSTVKDANNKFAFRIVCALDLPDDKVLTDYSKVGILISAYYNDGSVKVLAKDCYTTTVYNTISTAQGASECTAESLGGDYIFALVCNNVPAENGDVKIEATSYIEDSEGVRILGSTYCFTVVCEQMNVTQ